MEHRQPLLLVQFGEEGAIGVLFTGGAVSLPPAGLICQGKHTKHTGLGGHLERLSPGTRRSWLAWSPRAASRPRSADELNGGPLAHDMGRPLRLLLPGTYG